MAPTNNPQMPPAQAPPQPSMWDQIKNFLFGQGALKAAAQGAGNSLSPQPQAAPQSGGSDYLQKAVNDYRKSQIKKATNPQAVLAAPPKRKKTTP